jgi:hypothetical protein
VHLFPALMQGLFLRSCEMPAVVSPPYVPVSNEWAPPPEVRGQATAAPQIFKVEGRQAS